MGLLDDKQKIKIFKQLSTANANDEASLERIVKRITERLKNAEFEARFTGDYREVEQLKDLLSQKVKQLDSFKQQDGTQITPQTPGNIAIQV